VPLSGHKLCPLRPLTNLHPDALASIRYFCSIISHRIPATHSLHTSVPCPTHPYTFSRLFPRQAKLPLLRAILNSCSCLLLAYLVVMWQPSSVILYHGWANENWDPIFHFPPASYIIWYYD
jgi:hypothetical protein